MTINNDISSYTTAREGLARWCEEARRKHAAVLEDAPFPWSFSEQHGRDTIWIDIDDSQEKEVLSGETQAHSHWVKAEYREANEKSIEGVRKVVRYAVLGCNSLPALVGCVERLLEATCWGCGNAWHAAGVDSCLICSEHRANVIETWREIEGK